MPEIMVIGHRGAMAYETENSMSSFEAGLKMGAQMLEFDVHVSRDGEVVIMHDERVNRTTNGRGYISHMNLEELKALKLKNGEPIPTLQEVLERFRGRCQFNIEIKGRGANIPAYEIVSQLGMIDHVLFSSFSGPCLLKIKSRDKDARLACLSNESKMNVTRIARKLNAEAVHPKNNITTKKLILSAKEEGLAVNVWTVNRAYRMKKLINWGVDGIFTNKPDVLMNLLNGGQEK